MKRPIHPASKVFDKRKAGGDDAEAKGPPGRQTPRKRHDAYEKKE
jgi:hypothetical protein